MEDRAMRSRYWEISCDLNLNPDCEESFGPFRTSAELVKDARKAGWRLGPATGEDDVCPECRKHDVSDPH
jgi:hypothetical protein